MIDIALGDLPPTLQRLATAAGSVGWMIAATAADGPPTTVALRFAHGPYRAYGVWRTDGRLSFMSAATRHVPPGKFNTLRDLKTYLGVS